MSRRILAELKEYPLSNDDLKHLLPHTKIFTYPELEGLRSIDEIFHFHKKGDIGTAIMLYLTDSENVGHWVGLIKRGNQVEMYDPYGNPPEKLNQEVGGAMNGKQDPTLLRRKVEESGYKLISNPKQVQPVSMDINTCGRHVAMRLLFGKFPLREYNQKVSQLAKQNGKSIDDLATVLTASVLGK